MLVASNPVPPYTFFTDSVIRVLGRRTNMTPNEVVPLDDRLRAEILRESGIDPTKLPVEWIATLTDRPNGLYSRLNQSYRFLHHHTHRGRHGRAQGVAGRPKQWGLTELGVQEAARLLGLVEAPVVEAPVVLVVEPPKVVKAARPKRPERNLTAQWLDKHLRSTNGVESTLMRHLRRAVVRKCRVSVELGIAEDHIQEGLMRLIRRDSLRTRIETNTEITYTHIVTYIVRSAYTDIRDASTNPVTRELLGARTDKERKQAKKQFAESPRTVFPKNHQGQGKIVSGKAENDVANVLKDVVDQSKTAEDALSDRFRFEKVWCRMEDAMAMAKPEAWERYLNLLRLQVVEDFSVKEIAEQQDISPHRAAAMLQKARNILRDVGQDQLFAS